MRELMLPPPSNGHLKLRTWGSRASALQWCRDALSMHGHCRALLCMDCFVFWLSKRVLLLCPLQVLLIGYIVRCFGAPGVGPWSGSGAVHLFLVPAHVIHLSCVFVTQIILFCPFEPQLGTMRALLLGAKQSALPSRSLRSQQLRLLLVRGGLGADLCTLVVVDPAEGLPGCLLGLLLLFGGLCS